MSIGREDNEDNVVMAANAFVLIKTVEPQTVEVGLTLHPPSTSSATSRSRTALRGNPSRDVVLLLTFRRWPQRSIGEAVSVVYCRHLHSIVTVMRCSRLPDEHVSGCIIGAQHGVFLAWTVYLSRLQLVERLCRSALVPSARHRKSCFS